jgi:hypothetical protein
VFPPIYPQIAASPACVALLKSGAGELRFYQFGRAPQNVQKPYAVWQRVFGQPYNHMNERPTTDGFTVQIDVYSGSADSARTVAAAVRDAIEGVSYITNWLGESVDPDTGNYRFSLQSDWLVNRP